MPNAVLAQSLEDELEGSLLCNALSLIPFPIISVYALLWLDPSFLPSGFYYSISQRQTRFSRGVVKDATSPLYLPALNRPQNGCRWAALHTPFWPKEATDAFFPLLLEPGVEKRKGTRTGNTHMRMSHKEGSNRILLAALCLNGERPPCTASGRGRARSARSQRGELCSKPVASINGQGSRKKRSRGPISFAPQ